MDHLDFVQVKPYDGKYHIYCPESFFALGNREKTKCPDYVFIVPMTSTFTINDMTYVGTVMDLALDESLDPIFMEATKVHLAVSFNKTKLIQEIDEKTYHREITHTVHNGGKWVIMGIIICTLIMVGAASLFFMRHRLIVRSYLNQWSGASGDPEAEPFQHVQYESHPLTGRVRRLSNTSSDEFEDEVARVKFMPGDKPTVQPRHQTSPSATPANEASGSRCKKRDVKRNIS